MNTLAPQYAVIQIPDFALQAVLRLEPELRERAVALVDDLTPNSSPLAAARNHDGEDAQRTAKAHILQLSSAALRTGAQPGMSVSQARARCRDLLVRARSRAAEESAQAVLLECAWSVSSFVENTGPGVVTLEVRDSASSNPCFAFAEPDTARSSELTPIARRIHEHLERLHFTSKVGFGSTPDLALLAARTQCDGEPYGVVASADDLSDAPLGALGLPDAMFELLQRWGIRTIGGFTALGRGDLVRRLGGEVGAYFDRATGRIDRTLQCAQPTERFEECVEFEHEIETLEPLLFLLKRMVEQLVLRLDSIYRVPAELTLRLGLSQGEDHVRVFKIPSPTANPETLFRMLHTHLEGVTTEYTVVSLGLGAVPTRPVRQQFGLFESALRDPNQFAETLARLVALLGHDCVGTPVLEPSHRADAFRIQPADFTASMRRADAAALPLGLCLRRFRPAQPAMVECNRGPTYLHAECVDGAVVAAYGPMLRSGDWWSQHSWNRAEWDVKLNDGLLYRIYEEDGGWFVEGCYD